MHTAAGIYVPKSPQRQLNQQLTERDLATLLSPDP